AGLQGRVLARRPGFGPRAGLVVLDVGDGPADVPDPHRGAGLVGDDQVVPGLGVEHLVVGVDGDRLPRADEVALGRVHGIGADGGADGIELQAQARHLARVDLDADRGPLQTADVDLADAVDVRELL